MQISFPFFSFVLLSIHKKLFLPCQTTFKNKLELIGQIQDIDSMIKKFGTYSINAN